MSFTRAQPRRPEPGRLRAQPRADASAARKAAHAEIGDMIAAQWS